MYKERQSLSIYLYIYLGHEDIKEEVIIIMLTMVIIIIFFGQEDGHIYMGIIIM